MRQPRTTRQAIEGRKPNRERLSAYQEELLADFEAEDARRMAEADAEMAEAGLTTCMFAHPELPPEPFGAKRLTLCGNFEDPRDLVTAGPTCRGCLDALKRLRRAEIPTVQTDEEFPF